MALVKKEEGNDKEEEETDRRGGLHSERCTTQ
jgi:hypothetical protein